MTRISFLHVNSCLQAELPAMHVRLQALQEGSDVLRRCCALEWQLCAAWPGRRNRHVLDHH
jgi:hypothetical protein